MGDWLGRLARIMAKDHAKRRCGAKTRTGAPCAASPAKLLGKRCRVHGGLSTGPRTAEGRARVAEAQRRRWMKARAEGLTRIAPQNDEGTGG